MVMIKKIILLITSVYLHNTTTQAQRLTVGGNIQDGNNIYKTRNVPKALLLPRLSAKQRSTITKPIRGLQIYNTTTNSLEYYNGAAWVSLTQNYWLSHTNGIYYSSAHVGIKTTPLANIALTVQADVSGIGSNTGLFTSNDTWHSALIVKNNSTQYSFVVAGPNDNELQPQSFGLYNGNLGRWALTVAPITSYIGIGNTNPVASIPKSTLHVFNGDINIEQIGSGIILKSPNGQCWRITIDNSGNLVKTAIACP
jgi:hypothetical protein